MPIEELLDLERYPLDRIDSAEGRRLLASCVADLASDGMFNLVGLVRQPVLARIIAELRPVIDTAAFTHKRLHNIYFKKSIDGLPLLNRNITSLMISPMSLGSIVAFGSLANDENSSTMRPRSPT